LHNDQEAREEVGREGGTHSVAPPNGGARSSAVRPLALAIRKAGLAVMFLQELDTVDEGVLASDLVSGGVAGKRVLLGPFG
jgi:hypothetical protein